MKTKTLKNLALIFLLLVGFYSCQNEFIDASDYQREFDYFPLKTGQSWEYVYDSTLYLSGGSNIVQTSGFLKWEIGDSLENGFFELLKYFKRNQDDSYQAFRLERIAIDNNRLIITDQNLRFINLVFPPLLDASWDGNQFFDDQMISYIGGDPFRIYDSWHYRVSARDTTLTINQISYPMVVKVSQTDTENAIEKRLSEEYYARGTGLIYKKWMILDSQKIGSSLPWEQKAESGLIFTMSLIQNQ